MTTRPSNIWTALEDIDPGVRGARLLERPEGTSLASAVWELAPGAASGPYHLHHATEELLVVLSGEATVRTPDGERTLARGEVVHFPRGAPGAHRVENRSGEPLRYLMVAAHQGLDIIEYVDEGEVLAYSHRESLLADETLFVRHRLAQDDS